MTRTRTVLVLAAVAFAVALAGCAFGPGGAGDGDAPPVPDGDDAASTYRALGNVTGDLQVEVVAGDRSNRSTLRFAAEVGTRNVRQRVTAPAAHRGNRFISNDAYYWRYDASADVARRYAHTDATFESTFGTGDDDDFGAFLAAAFDAANESDGTVAALPNVGVGPAPTVVGGDDDAASTPRPSANVSEFVVTYAGTDTVADERTHVLVVEPADANATAARNLTITYYVDRERFFPVRVERRATVDGEPWSHVMTFSNLTYGANVSASTYRYEPGERTEVVDYATGVVRFPTVDALAANSTVPVPDPSVPDGFEFAYAAGIDLNATGGQLIYSNESTVLVAGRYLSDDIIQSRERSVAENVTVDGHSALYVDLGRTQAVYVYCDDYVVSAASIGPYPRDALVAFASSLDCEPEGSDRTAGAGSSALADAGHRLEVRGARDARGDGGGTRP
jgi:outer membrane lipoprotein-sorting protein